MSSGPSAVWVWRGSPSGARRSSQAARSRRAEGSAFSWINKDAEELRRRKARPPRRDIPAEEMSGLKDAGPTPEDNWVRSSRQRMVHRALRELSEINREIILLKDMQGLALDEIAHMLDLPVGTVKSRSSRARIELSRVVRDMVAPPGAEVSA